MTLEEYFAFAGAEAERPVFRVHGTRDSGLGFRRVTGLESEEEDLDSFHQRVRQHPHLPRRPGRSRPGCATGETMAEKIHT